MLCMCESSCHFQFTTYDLRLTSTIGYEELDQNDGFESRDGTLVMDSNFCFIDHLSIYTASRTLIEENMQSE